MEAYTSFASVYDTFMDNIPYEEWAEYLSRLLAEYEVTDGIVLDLGCGTGTLTELMAARGFDMIGVDYSEEMLEIAMEKRAESGRDILYLLQDMREFELYGTVRAVISICDSLNYITEEAVEGATLIVNCSASNEIAGKEEYRRSLIAGQSARLLAGYVYANAGEGESTTDLVFGGHNIIAENGEILKESKRFTSGAIYSEIDVEMLLGERRKNTTFQRKGEYSIPYIPFEIEKEETMLTRKIPMSPFVPENKVTRSRQCEEILMIQAVGLKKRMLHTNCQRAVVGISGGLDSTLALLVTAKSFDLLGIDRSQILSVTMPCFGTTDRTYQNACRLTKKLGATLREIPIQNAVRVHFEDIGQSEEEHDVTYENAQARERTQILMDLANKTNGMVIGTGDMSELALGWATYSGDHMSMYGVNASVPKTLVYHLVRYYAEECEDPELKGLLFDILDTPVSPELLPPKDGEIVQKTEETVGPYELHDFYLYYVLRFGYEPSKIYRLAKYAFGGIYEDEIILKWLKKFYWRFFSQQFKRSCLPDGPKTGTVSLSPRGDWRMPSDACVTLWQKDLDALE